MVLSLPLTYSRHLPRSTNLTPLQLPHTGLSQKDELKLLSNQQNTSCSQLTMDLALLSVRNTPLAGQTFSPAQRLFSCSLRSDLPQPAATLKPFTSPRDSVLADHAHRKLKQKNAYDKHASATLFVLPPGSYVYSRPQLISTSKAWILGKIVGHAGPRSYLIDTGKNQIRRNCSSSASSSPK